MYILCSCFLMVVLGVFYKHRSLPELIKCVLYPCPSLGTCLAYENNKAINHTSRNIAVPAEKHKPGIPLAFIGNLSLGKRGSNQLSEDACIKCPTRDQIKRQETGCWVTDTRVPVPLNHAFLTARLIVWKWAIVADQLHLMSSPRFRIMSQVSKLSTAGWPSIFIFIFKSNVKK